jgi:glucose/arabinose dehydrogenase
MKNNPVTMNPVKYTALFAFRRFIATPALLFLIFQGYANAAAVDIFESERHRFRLTALVEGLDHPWGMAFLPDGGILVTERPGRLRLIRDGARVSEPISGLPSQIEARGQGGLLDVALHPNFEQNRWVYLSYTGRGKNGLGTEVIRGRLHGTTLTDIQIIFRALPKPDGGRHFGSRLLFDPEGFLYITLGDRGDRRRAQDLSDHAGSLIRLRDDGRAPASNPFVNQSGVRPEIYTYGNRNIQGIALQPNSHLIWMHEHGPQGGDEVNIVQAGTNYGWPIITYGIGYDGSKIGEGVARAGMAQPVHYWDPSIAPSGMAFYDGNRFPNWRGDLFVGALKFQLLVRLEVQGQKIVGEERLLTGAIGRIRDVRQGPDGLLYLLTDASDGGLYRLEPVDD